MVIVLNSNRSNLFDGLFLTKPLDKNLIECTNMYAAQSWTPPKYLQTVCFNRDSIHKETISEPSVIQPLKTEVMTALSVLSSNGDNHSLSKSSKLQGRREGKKSGNDYYKWHFTNASHQKEWDKRPEALKKSIKT